MLRDFGFRPACIFPDVSDDWAKVARAKAKYAVVRRRLTTLAKAQNIDGAEALTLHSPRNFLPSLRCQAGYSCEGRSRLGHWSLSSPMPERYNRLACVDELRIRSDILRLLEQGWAPAAPFEVPAAATRPGLGGNAPGGYPADVGSLKVRLEAPLGDGGGAVSSSSEEDLFSE